jgi:hypothetical protein
MWHIHPTLFIFEQIIHQSHIFLAPYHCEAPLEASVLLDSRIPSLILHHKFLSLANISHKSSYGIHFLKHFLFT